MTEYTQQLKSLIQNRRTVRAFTERPVDEKLITDLLGIATWVPNFKLTEPWRFVLSSSAGVKEELFKLFYNRNIANNSPEEDAIKKASKWREIPLNLWVVQKNAEDLARRAEDLASIHCVIQNFLLLVHAEGLGAFWRTTPATAPELREILRVQETESIVACVSLGYPAEGSVKERRAPEEAQFRTVIL